MRLEFSPNDPFPLLAPGKLTLAEAQEHSAAVDAWLGLETERIEREIAGRAMGDQVLWIGLPVRSLLTPYTEFRAMLEELAPAVGETVVDLGAGYGRMGFVLHQHWPGVRFVGYEYVLERVVEGNRCLALFGAEPALFEADLAASSFMPTQAGYYFLYDFGSRAAIAKALSDLRRVAASRSITVVARGRSSRDAIERGEPWLSQVVPPRHFGNWSVFRSA